MQHALLASSLLGIILFSSWMSVSLYFSFVGSEDPANEDFGNLTMIPAMKPPFIPVRNSKRATKRGAGGLALLMFNVF